MIPHGVHIPVESTKKRENLVLFVGAIQRRKNVARLVRAFEAMPAGWRLVLALPRRWGQKRNCAQWSRVRGGRQSMCPAT